MSTPERRLRRGTGLGSSTISTHSFLPQEQGGRGRQAREVPRQHQEGLPLSSRSVMSKSCLTPWAAARQAPLSLGFSRQEDWSALPFPSPGDLPNPGIKPRYPALQADSLPLSPLGHPPSGQMTTNSRNPSILCSQGDSPT